MEVRLPTFLLRRAIKSGPKAKWYGDAADEVTYFDVKKSLAIMQKYKNDGAVKILRSLL